MTLGDRLKEAQAVHGQAAQREQLADLPQMPCLDLSAARQFGQSPWLRTRLEDMSAQDIDAVQGPTALTVLSIVPELIFTKDAWPHTDAHWAGSVFYTMTVDGDMFEFGSLSRPGGMRAALGKVFRVDPLELHWLRPDPVVSIAWLALQWVVPIELAEAFEQELAAAIETWNLPSFSLPLLGHSE